MYKRQAKIIAKTLIYSDGDASSYGQNAFFYDAAEGLMTSTILLIAEFADPEQRHIRLRLQADSRFTWAV